VYSSARLNDSHTLQGKITTSKMNVKQIATGKRVMGVFEAEHKRLTDDGD